MVLVPELNCSKSAIQLLNAGLHAACLIKLSVYCRKILTSVKCQPLNVNYFSPLDAPSAPITSLPRALLDEVYAHTHEYSVQL